MKKLLVYVFLLFVVFVIVQTVGVNNEDEQVRYELEHAAGSSGISRGALESQMDVSDALVESAGAQGEAGAGSGAGEAHAKEKFDQDLLSPQDLSGSSPQGSAKSSKNGVGNDVKAEKAGSKVAGKAADNAADNAADKDAQRMKDKAPYQKDQ